MGTIPEREEDLLPRFLPMAAPRAETGPVPGIERAARHASLWLVDQSRLGPRAGQRVAIAVGSRGLAGLVPILAQLTGLLRQRGAQPEIVPAMGSHGGGTGSGQAAVLAGLGVTEQVLRAAVVAAPDRPALAGRTPAGRPVWCHPAALRADRVVLLNRVKSHTAFDGEVQSGLLKMLAVGLGGPPGAHEAHRAGAGGIGAALIDLARFLAGRLRLAGGLATVENAAGELVFLDAAPGRWPGLREVEAGCLALARRVEPRLPVDDLDLLIVDRMGKDITGPGMDPKVVGRRRVWDSPEPDRPRVRRLVVLRLTPASGGNANGVGLADFTTRRLADAIDWPKTLKNVRATGFTQRAALPPVFANDREAVEAAVESLRPSRPVDLRAMRLRDTAHLGRVWVSAALSPDLETLGWVRLGEAAPLPFGENGDLSDLEP